MELSGYFNVSDALIPQKEYCLYQRRKLNPNWPEIVVDPVYGVSCLLHIRYHMASQTTEPKSNYVPPWMSHILPDSLPTVWYQNSFVHYWHALQHIKDKVNMKFVIQFSQFQCL
jgi:hypothetical protein